jgi:beta-glucanase (GH16 family)
MGGNLHVSKAPGLTHHPPNPAGWIAPFHLAKEWHSYGIDWGPAYIRWYIDGTCFRSVRNTHWHTPLRMLFDTEIWSWWPDPLPEHFPSTFRIDYVRAWSRADWPEPTDLEVLPMGKNITKLLEAERVGSNQ